MRTDKEIKQDFLKQASQNPKQFYATEVLDAYGFSRKQCSSCQRFFWTVHEDQDVCGDSSCQGRIDIFTNNPSKKALSFQEVWSTFAEHMSARGYTKISRYPVVARWNPTTDFVMASIAAFQPYVVSGEVAPPANKLVIPQFSLRFGDVDNVGVTGSHCTGFVMIGQHQFVSPTDWDQNKAFEDLFTYLTDVVGLPKEELTLHEDAWAGGGNFGPCMEFFSRGVELCNQVYMLYEQTVSGRKELSIKVLDMGLGQERVAWFTQATPTLYDATFPFVIKKLQEATGVAFDTELYTRFAPYATLLNLDEVDDIVAAWRTVSEKVGVSVSELRTKIEPMKALYSVAEHARALLVALADGALPGNAGGYYNLRVIYRRAQNFIEEYGWAVDMRDVVSWHAQELSEQFPELQENLSDVQKLLGVEYDKFKENKKRAKKIVEQALKKPVSTEVLLELYDSNGISPEFVRKEAKRVGIDVVVPENFYGLVSQRHEQQQKTHVSSSREFVDLSETPDTDILYYDSYDLLEAQATILKIVDNNVVVDRTIFYPTSGGQLHDTGTINDAEVVDVFKHQGCVVHVCKDASSLEVGMKVRLVVDASRRIQLTQHHTAAHVINGAAKEVLGNHVWQAGAAKTLEKGRLDITHFEALSDKEVASLEEVASRVIADSLPVLSHQIKKSVAESEWGFRLYQGGAVPGNIIRVVEIPGFDVEACGGTHVKTTSELEEVKILKTSKIQDGVVRIEFVAGGAARNVGSAREELLEECMQLLGITDENLLVSRTEELFKKWKKVKKLRKKNKEIPKDLLELSAPASEVSDPLSQAAASVKTQEEHLPKTLKRFLDEWRGS
ncbi:MAG: alanine--tRNA ligase [Candidatus Woesearchaeota archaeon]